MRPRDASREPEAGIAMVTVIMGVLAIVLMTVLIQQITINQTAQSDFQAKEDSVLATTEAILERYAAKLTIDPVYYQRWVDESEAPRVCTDNGSLWYGTRVDPGNAWHENCQNMGLRRGGYGELVSPSTARWRRRRHR